MFCQNCGTEHDNAANFCPTCGQKVRHFDGAVDIQSLSCTKCGATLCLTEGEVAFCPQCGTKHLINESENVRIERIKSAALVEVEKAKAEVEKARIESTNTQQREQVK